LDQVIRVSRGYKTLYPLQVFRLDTPLYAVKVTWVTKEVKQVVTCVNNACICAQTAQAKVYSVSQIGKAKSIFFDMRTLAYVCSSYYLTELHSLELLSR
jgi:hypothetical protein